LLRKRHLLVVSALTSHQFCHNYAPANTTSRMASIAEFTHPLKLQSYRSGVSSDERTKSGSRFPGLDTNRILILSLHSMIAPVTRCGRSITVSKNSQSVSLHQIAKLSSVIADIAGSSPENKSAEA
jgi:hypothetical protein